MKRTADKSRTDSNASNAFVAYVASLHRAVHGLALYFDAALPRITQAEATLLLYLGATPKQTINDVHRAFLHRRSTLTSVLDRMEKHGFLTRSPSASDRRSLTLTLTSAGRKAADRIAAALAELERELGTPQPQIAAAARLLEQTAQTAVESIDLR